LGADYDFLRAVQNNYFDRVKQDLESSPELANDVSAYSPSPLNAAADTGNIDLVQLLLDHRADPLLPEDNAPTGCALYCAVGHNNYPIAERLLEHGADPMCYSDSSGDCLLVVHEFIEDAADQQRMIELLNKYSGEEHILIPQRNDDPPIEETAAKVREVLSRQDITGLASWPLAACHIGSRGCGITRRVH
jgi:ankyrin repeat protein